MRRAWSSAGALLLAPLLASCATVGGARPWGEQVTLAPGKRTLGRAIVRTVAAPRTWAPLAAAAVLQIDGMDRRAAHWASDHTPIFQSRTAADDASFLLDNLAAIACGTSIAIAPSGETIEAWVANKARGGALDLAALGAAQGAVSGLKRAVGRTRPNGADARSFPSGHATRSAAAATLAQRNLRHAFGGHAAARAAEIATFAMAAGCAWSRVEAGAHYPADVLAGMALGHLVAAIVNDAFVVPGGPVTVRTSLAPGGGGAIVVSWRP